MLPYFHGPQGGTGLRMAPRRESTLDLAAAQASPAAARVPWYIWCCVLAVTSGSVGGAWDISWHKSIGRDTFWTPAHMAIYLCGVLAGFSCGYLILSMTFRKVPAAPCASVRVWGFRGPLGAFICAWGALAMITSAPFDNWWHAAYGLDVKILSPPHVLLIIGMMAIRVGTLILVLGAMHQTSGSLRARLHGLVLYSFTFLVLVAVGMFEELLLRNYMHSARFYLLLAAGVPLLAAALPRVSSLRWCCTVMMAVYTAFYLLLILILPLFPAEPKLGPVFQHVTHFVPPEFPLLLIVPAFFLDLWRPRWERRGAWLQSAATGALFLAAFVAVQWPFADFLMSPASRNRFFVTNEFPYFVPPAFDWVRNVFTPVEHSPAEFWRKMLLALLSAVLSARAGLSWGDWLRRIRR